MRKSMILAAVLTVMGAATALAQGIVVNKTDGSKVYFKASEVVSVTTYGYGEDGPHAPAGAEAVDLGLPSGTMWANMNVGAEKSEDYGDYFAWGETEPKEVYNWDTYQYGSSENDVEDIGSDIAGTAYDAATANWGTPWRMPSVDQIKELLENCSYEWTTLNGVKGGKFTSKKNGNSIFLPAAGYRWYGEFDYVGTYGYYWSSTLYESDPFDACYLYFDSGNAYWSNYGYGVYRDSGRSVRPVRKN